MLRKTRSMFLFLVIAFAVVVPPAAAADLQTSLNTFLSNLPADFETVAGKTLHAKQQSGENVFILDVREPEEFKAGHIEGAVNVPIRTLANNGSQLPQDKNAPVAVVCKSGIRAAYATMALKMLGHTNVKDVVGGMLAWEKEGLSVTK